MMFYRLLREQDVPITVTFPDVPTGAWYETAVYTLASLDIIAGYEDGTFGPERDITRAEFTTIAMRFAEAIGGSRTFSDVPATHWAYSYISTAAEYGWIDGYSDGTFGPGKAITRAEVVTIVNHMLGRACDPSYADTYWDQLKQFTDLQNKSAWYFYDMVEATNAHDYDHGDDGTERWLNQL